MRFPGSVPALVVCAAVFAAEPFLYYAPPGSDPWPEILGAVGLVRATSAEQARIVVLGDASPAPGWEERMAAGAIFVVEGESPLAAALGIRSSGRRFVARSVEDLHRPALRVVWERPVELPIFTLPEEARLLARERWEKAPLVAAVRRGRGGALWLACPPGKTPYARFPYLLQALADLGLEPPLASRRLWAFFDSSYRSRVDLDYFARRWRRTGIAALHVAAWHFFEPDPERDAYLKRLIEACHRNAVLVYAWLELPHVSERFWQQHPQWREKTALLQDAHLDWRKLMNLANPDCARAVRAGVRQLIERFDFDGVNLAELYFESLEGAANPARFTPMNDDVRREFRALAGFDPLELFQPDSPRHLSRNPQGLAAFLDYRARLAARLQREWIAELESLRSSRPHLDLALTHVDDRFDTRMREAVGADAAALLPLLERHAFTFLVEDPATVWHLGPQRYREIARRYQELTPRWERLGVDINIVERYQDVYPTKQQTGTELFLLVRAAAEAFPRVALYFERSLLEPDLPLLPAAAAPARRLERRGGRLLVEAQQPLGVRWRGPVRVNGKPWPARDDETVWLPAGLHVLEQAGDPVAVRLLDLNAELLAAEALPGGLEFAYRSSSRAIAVLDRAPVAIEVDGEPARLPVIEDRGRFLVFAPRGRHLVAVRVEPPSRLLN
ncbi:MAG: hypothetical protein RMI94_02755 [Bryobacterales bacterium]|nr:family 10 glycosylhydrolase [Bryobacteraceae bacterium]MDW8129441.1 hypothetical protein [Bryobacterales bacterium]